MTNQTYFDIPEISFILSDTQKKSLLNVLQNSGQMIVTTVVQFVTPTISRYVVNIIMSIFEGYDPTTTKGQIIDSLSTYFIGIRRRDKIPRSDLIAIIEAIPGVDSVNVLFLSQKNEVYQSSISNLPSTDPKTKIVLGLDEFGDIIFEQDEIAIITGGWSDRAGVYYDTGANLNKLSSVNIDIISTTPITYNTQINSLNKQVIINSSSNTSSNTINGTTTAS